MSEPSLTSSARAVSFASGSAAITAAAWLAFALAALMVRTLGFPRVHKTVRAWRVRQPRRQRDAGELLRSIDAAARLSLVPIRCLERAFVTTCLLRFFGHPAAFVVGVRRVPFYAHAWTELGGAIVTDPPEKIRDLVEIERC
jgi:Transglutaminase-like superfamily